MTKLNIKDKIVNELIDLDLQLNGIVFEYWLDVLMTEYKGKFKNQNMMEKYEYLAQKHNCSMHSTERALRRGTEQMRKRIVEKYNIKTKITNETIIILFKLKVF